MFPEIVNTVRAAQIANVMKLVELARKNPHVLQQSDTYPPEDRAAAKSFSSFEGNGDLFPWEEVLQQMDEAVKARSV